MAYSETVDVRGKQYEAIAAYFDGVEQCIIELKKMEDVKLGAISLERVIVTITGNQNDVTKVVAAFRLNFLTMGG